MQELEVGKPFELFAGRDYSGIDGCMFELLHDGSFVLIVYMNNMTEKEREVLRKTKIETRIIQETDYFIIHLIKFTGTPLIFEIDFDPTLYPDERKDMIAESNMVSIIGVESNDNTIQTLRLANMPLGLHEKLVAAWIQAKEIEGFSKKYKAWIMDLQSRYSVLGMWKMGVYMGKRGD